MATTQKTIQIDQHRQSIEVALDPAADEVDLAVEEPQQLPAPSTAA